jgi:hypothetical protein
MVWYGGTTIVVPYHCAAHTAAASKDMIDSYHKEIGFGRRNNAKTFNSTAFPTFGLEDECFWAFGFFGKHASIKAITTTKIHHHLFVYTPFHGGSFHKHSFSDRM